MLFIPCPKKCNQSIGIEVLNCLEIGATEKYCSCVITEKQFHSVKKKAIKEAIKILTYEAKENYKKQKEAFRNQQKKRMEEERQEKRAMMQIARREQREHKARLKADANSYKAVHQWLS